MRTLRLSALLLATIVGSFTTGACSMPTGPSTAPSTTESESEAGAVGPLVVDNGVGHGWRHDADGAVAAASNAVSVTGAIATAGFITRNDLIASIASDEYAAELASVSSRQLDELSIELGEAGIAPSEIVWSELPLRARLVSHSTDEAVVEVWAVLVVGVPGHGAPRQVWRTVTVGLVWEREDWRIDRWEAAAGPTPALAANSLVSSVDEVARVLAWPTHGGS